MYIGCILPVGIYMRTICLIEPTVAALHIIYQTAQFDLGLRYILYDQTAQDNLDLRCTLFDQTASTAHII